LSLPFFSDHLALLAASLVVALVVTGFVDRFAIPAKIRRASRPGGAPATSADFLARIPVVLLAFSVFFAVSWRPIYTLGATVSTFAIFTVISRAKFEFIREPLVFSDIALAFLVFRHKEMFRANWLSLGFWIVAFVYVFGASTLFMIFEPPILPDHARSLAIPAMIIVAATPWLLLFDQHARQALSNLAATAIGGDDIKVLTARLGTCAAVLYGFLAWLGKRRPTLPLRPAPAPCPKPRAPGIAYEGKPLLVVWQSESFMDMRHFGMEQLYLPNLDRLRRRAVEWGRMSSIFEGGYTLRTEFSVISGLPPDRLGPDASHPYLRAATYAGIAWPNRFRAAGWNTQFVHPYDPRFFSRDRAMPALGFETLTMLDAFDHDREREGPYVSDLTLSKRLLEFCRGDGRGKGQFLFAASMENHGPWYPGRHGDAVDPVDIYLAILQRSDAALGYLADELDRLDRPVWLAFYGDHAPILKSFADPFPDPRTEYLIVPMSRAAACAVPSPRPAEKAPWDIIADTVAHAGLEELLAVPGGGAR
jgi:phosphoglycerol transferase MdoB-like AlkP superfamily enzyme